MSLNGLPSKEEIEKAINKPQTTTTQLKVSVNNNPLPSKEEIEFALKKKESTVLDGTSTSQTQDISTSTENSLPQQNTERDGDNFLGNMGEQIVSGTLRLPVGIAKFGTLVDDLTNEAGNATSKLLQNIGVDKETADKTGKGLNYSKYFFAPMTLGVAKGYDLLNKSGLLEPVEEKADELAEKGKSGYEDTFTNYWKAGEYDKAIGTATLDAMQSLPGTLLTVASGGAGVTALGAGSAGEKYDNLKNSNIDANQYILYTNSLMTGMLEGLTEYLGTATYGKLLTSEFKRLGEKVAKENLEKGITAWMVNNFKRMGLYTAPLGESIEEGVNQIGQNITDKITGVNNNIGITEGFWNSAIPGLMGGTMFVAPKMAADVINSNVFNKKQANYLKNVEESLNDIRSDISEAKTKSKEEVETRPVEQNLEPLPGKPMGILPENEDQNLASQPMMMDQKMSVIIDKFNGIKDTKEAKNVIENLTPEEVKTLSIGLIPGEKTNKNKLAESVLQTIQEKQNANEVPQKTTDEPQQIGEQETQEGQEQKEDLKLKFIQEQFETATSKEDIEMVVDNMTFKDIKRVKNYFDYTGNLDKPNIVKNIMEYMAKGRLDPIVPQNETSNIKQQEPAPILQEKLTESVKEFPVKTIGQKIGTALKKLHANTLKIGGAMPKDIRNLWDSKRHKVNGLIHEVAINDSQWRKALKKEYGSKPTEPQKNDLNIALANLGKNNINAEEALKDIPNSLHEPLKKMRNNIDSLTDEFRSMGISTDLDVTLDKNTGHYVTRAYKMHYDPNYKWENINTDIKTNAVNNELFRRDPELFQKIKTENPELAKVFDANKRVINNESINSGMELRNKMLESNPDLVAVVENIKGEFKSMIDQAGEGGFKNSGRITKTEDGNLIQRESIPPDIRSLMGEYHDPSINSVLTQVKQIELIEQYKFLDKLTKMYEGEHFSQTRTEEFSEPLMSQGEYSKWFTTPEIKESLNVPKFGMDVPWLKTYMQINGLVKYGLTVASPSTIVRNFTSGYQMQMMNGRLKYYPFVEGLNPWMGKSGKIGINPLYPIPVINYFKFMKNPKYAKQRMEYFEQGILGESLRGEEMKNVADFESYADRLSRDPNKVLELSKRAAQGSKDAMAKLSYLYEAMDNIHRIYAYEVEKYRYNKIFNKKYKTKTKEEINELVKEKAGKIVNATYQTFSKTPPIVKWLRTFPFIAPFPGFTSEVIRTYANTMGLVAQELKSKDSAAVGMERAIGLTAATSIYAGVAGASYMLAGLLEGDDDKEKEKEKYNISKRFISLYSQPSDIVSLGTENGMFKFIDIGNSSTLGYFNRIARRSFNKDVGMDDATIISGIEESLRPFVDEDILAGKILDVMRNENPMTGGKIYNPEEDNKSYEMFKYIISGTKPGSFRDVGDIYKSFTTDNYSGAKVKTPAQTITKMLTGFKVTTVDLNKAWSYTMDDYSERIGNIISLYSKPLYAYNKLLNAELPSNASPEDIEGYNKKVSEYQVGLEETRLETEEKLNSIVKRLSKDYVDLQKTGVLQDDLDVTLKQLNAGKYKDNVITNAIKNGDLIEINSENGDITTK